MHDVDDDVRRVQRAYPRLYLACHVEHTRARSTRHALSTRDASILAHLDPGRPTRPRELARHLSVGLSTVSETLDRLDELGYVSRTRSAHDRRAVEVRLTVKGDRAMRATSVLDADRLARVLASMPDGERWRAVAGLELLARAAVDVNKKGASGSKTASGRRAAGARPESKRGPRGTTRKGTR